MGNRAYSQTAFGQMNQSPSKTQLNQRPGTTVNMGSRGQARTMGASPDMSPMRGTLKSASKNSTMKKRKQSPKKAEHHHHHDDHHHHPHHVELESPTSISMKNSYIIKNADPSFETYYNTMRKRSKVLSSMPTIPEYNAAATTALAKTDASGVRTQGKRPMARDGHTGLIFGDTFVVFGGDRHHMPFNDVFTLDLKADFNNRRRQRML